MGRLGPRLRCIRVTSPVSSVDASLDLLKNRYHNAMSSQQHDGWVCEPQITHFQSVMAYDAGGLGLGLCASGARGPTWRNASGALLALRSPLAAHTRLSCYCRLQFFFALPPLPRLWKLRAAMIPESRLARSTFSSPRSMCHGQSHRSARLGPPALTAHLHPTVAFGRKRTLHFPIQQQCIT